MAFRHLPAAAVLASLALGCAAEPPRPSPGPTPAAMGSMAGMAPGTHHHMQRLSPAEAEHRYRLQIHSDPPLRQGAESRLTVLLHGPDGRPVTNLQTHHERLAHFLVVSENLSDFHHLHAEDFGLLTAEARQAGRFELLLTPAHGGRYLLAMDFVENMLGAHLSQELEVAGPEQPATRWDFTPRRHGDDLVVQLSTRPWPVVAGDPMVGTLTLTTSRGEPIDDLRPYLGARAHLAVFRDRISGSAHLHGTGPEDSPFSAAGISAGTPIHFEHRFEQAGRYRMFVQFRRGETVHTIPLDLQVEEPAFHN